MIVSVELRTVCRVRACGNMADQGTATEKSLQEAAGSAHAAGVLYILKKFWSALCASKTVSTQHMPAITASCTLQRLVSLCTQSQSRQPAGVTMLAIHLGSKAVSTGHAPQQRVHLVQGVDITSGLRALDACQCNTCELVQRNKSLQHLMPFLRRARTSNCMTDSGSGLGDREHASCWLQPHHVQCPEFCIYQFCWRLL